MFRGRSNGLGMKLVINTAICHAYSLGMAICTLGMAIQPAALYQHLKSGVWPGPTVNNVAQCMSHLETSHSTCDEVEVTCT